MADAGLELIRVFALWDLIEPREGLWDFACFDAVFDQAEQRGLGVVPTAFSTCPPGWMRRSIASQQVIDPWDPEVRVAGEGYLRRLVDRYAAHPALHSWIVWNEAGMVVEPSPAATTRFQAFLAQTYGSIDRLNDRYYGQHTSFDQVEPPRMDQDAEVPIPSHLQRIDWWRFCAADVAAAVSRFTEIIRERDPRHPVHLNPHRLGHCMLHEGQSVWQIADVVDFVGCSAHPVWHSTRFGPGRATQSIGLFSAMCRGASRQPRRFWVSELQGGPATFSGIEAGCPSPTELTHWMWESIGRGAEAVVFWTFNGRREGGEVGEWMLLDQRGRPSRRLDAVSEVIGQLAQHRGLFLDTQPPRPRVGLLCSESSLLHGFAYGRGEDVADPRNAQRNADAVCGAFCLLDDLHLEVGVLDESRLQEPGRLEGYEVLVLPDCWSLESSTIARLLEYVQLGGCVIADGLVGYLDSHTRRHECATETIDRLFGGSLVDILPITTPFTLATPAPVPGWFNRITLEANEAEALVRWPTGDAAVTECRHPMRGRAVRIGTHLFQHYLSSPNAEARRWVRSLLPASAWSETHFAEDTPPQVRLRRLEHTDGSVLIVINTTDQAQRVRLRGIEGGHLVDISGSSRLDAVNGEVEIALEPNQVRLLLAREPRRHPWPARVDSLRQPLSRSNLITEH